MELSLELTPSQQQQLELAQHFDHLTGIEVVRRMDGFFKWYLEGIRRLSQTGLVIIPIGARNSAGKSSTADAIEFLLRTDPQQLQSLQAEYPEHLAYLQQHWKDIRVTNVAITTTLEASRRNGIFQKGESIGRLSPKSYRRLSQEGMNVVAEELADYSPEKPKVIIIQKGVPTVHLKDHGTQLQIDTQTSNLHKAHRRMQSQLAGRDRFESIGLFFLGHPQFTESTMPLYLIRSQSVLRRGLHTRTRIKSNEMTVAEALQQSGMHPVLRRTTSSSSIVGEQLPRELQIAIEHYYQFGQMPADRIQSVTDQQQRIIRGLHTEGAISYAIQPDYYEYLLVVAGLEDPSEQRVLITENPFYAKPLPTNLRLQILSDPVLRHNPQLIGLDQIPEINEYLPFGTQ